VWPDRLSDAIWRLRSNAGRRAALCGLELDVLAKAGFTDWDEVPAEAAAGATAMAAVTPSMTTVRFMVCSLPARLIASRLGARWRGVVRTCDVPDVTFVTDA
jgi:hypothetical protein